METQKQVLTAQQLLKWIFTLIPIAAGADKFLNLLAQWADYLPAWMINISPLGAHTVMMIVGVIEIVAGILVFIKPKIGSLVVCAWLALIGILLISSGKYLDVAVRDLVMAGSAYTLFLLTGAVEEV